MKTMSYWDTKPENSFLSYFQMTNDTKLLRLEANKTISNAHNYGQTTDERHCPEVSDVANKKVYYV